MGILLHAPVDGGYTLASWNDVDVSPHISHYIHHVEEEEVFMEKGAGMSFFYFFAKILNCGTPTITYFTKMWNCGQPTITCKLVLGLANILEKY